MGFPIYTCSADYPDRIPHLLQGIGAKVEPTPTQTPDSFGFRITRGLGAVRIVGGAEGDGIMFYVVWGRNLNPFTWWSSSHLSNEVEAKLRAAGAQPAWRERKSD